MQKLGLTGNICAGKSEAEEIFKNKGFMVIDLDKTAHRFLENSEEIKNHFKTLDRKKIAEIVFSDPDEKKYLESILHPMLFDFVQNELKKDYDKILVSGALLYEAGFDKLFDKMIFIDAPYDIRLQRLMKRNNLDEAAAKKRMDCQNDRNKSLADFIIDNSKSIEELKKAIDLIL